MSIRSNWSARSVYLYAVCLITLVMTIFATVNLVRTIVELAYPDPGYYTVVAKIAGEPELDPDELAKQNEFEVQRTRRYSVLNLVGSGALLLIAVPLYAYHWRKIESEARLAAKEFDAF